MKKILAILTASCMLLLSSCALFGVREHDHVFEGDWIATGGYHYKNCSFDGCKEQTEKETHTFKNGKCEICGYSQQSIVPKD